MIGSFLLMGFADRKKLCNFVIHPFGMALALAFMLPMG
jgi:hypothetical protein